MSRVPRLARGCRLGADGTLLMPEGIIKLSDTGRKIIELCDGKRTLDEIVAAIQAGYAPELHERIVKDVQDYLDKLAERKAVELA